MIDASIAGEEKNECSTDAVCNSGMVITLINHMLGGEDVVAVEDDYRYSDVERALYKRIVELYDRCFKGWIFKLCDALLFP